MAIGGLVLFFGGAALVLGAGAALATGGRRLLAVWAIGVAVAGVAAISYGARDTCEAGAECTPGLVYVAAGYNALAWTAGMLAARAVERLRRRRRAGSP